MARASALKTIGGKLVSARSKTGDPACSAAMSQWVRARNAGAAVAAGVFKILAGCRAKARQNRGAALGQASGKLAEGRGTWERSERAKALAAHRAAARPAPAPSPSPLRALAAAHRARKGLKPDARDQAARHYRDLRRKAADPKASFSARHEYEATRAAVVGPHQSQRHHDRAKALDPGLPIGGTATSMTREERARYDLVKQRTELPKYRNGQPAAPAGPGSTSGRLRGQGDRAIAARKAGAARSAQAARVAKRAELAAKRAEDAATRPGSPQALRAQGDRVVAARAKAEGRGTPDRLRRAQELRRRLASDRETGAIRLDLDGPPAGPARALAPGRGTADRQARAAKIRGNRALFGPAVSRKLAGFGKKTPAPTPAPAAPADPRSAAIRAAVDARRRSYGLSPDNRARRAASLRQLRAERPASAPAPAPTPTPTPAGPKAPPIRLEAPGSDRFRSAVRKLDGAQGPDGTTRRIPVEQLSKSMGMRGHENTVRYLKQAERSGAVELDHVTGAEAAAIRAEAKRSGREVPIDPTNGAVIAGWRLTRPGKLDGGAPAAATPPGRASAPKAAAPTPTPARPKAPAKAPRDPGAAVDRLKAINGRATELEADEIDAQVRGALEGLTGPQLKEVQRRYLGATLGKTKAEQVEVILDRIHSNRASRDRGAQIMAY